MSLKKSLRIMFVALLCSVALSATGQSKDLILETDPETVIPLIGTVTLDAETGALHATPEDPEICAEPTTDCEGVDVAVLSFTANSAGDTLTVTQGNDVRFRWETRGAWECEGSGFPGWDGTGKPDRNPSNGQLVSTTNITPDTYAAQLTCLNGASDSSIVNVVVEEDDGSGIEEPSGCEERQPPAGWTHKNQCIYQSDADCRSFADVWSAWPGSSNTRNFYLDASNGGKRYVAMQFDSGNLSSGETGLISYNVPQFGSNIDQGPVMISISPCPGDFHHGAIAEDMGPACTQHNSSSLTANFRWGGSDYIEDTGRCGLEPNKTYYYNMLYASPTTTLGTDPDDLLPWCTSSACGHNITP